MQIIESKTIDSSTVEITVDESPREDQLIEFIFDGVSLNFKYGFRSTCVKGNEYLNWLRTTSCIEKNPSVDNFRLKVILEENPLIIWQS